MESGNAGGEEKHAQHLGYLKLKRTVESFAESLDQGEVVKSARDIRQRARACKHVDGATFEGGLKRILRDLDQAEE